MVEYYDNFNGSGEGIEWYKKYVLLHRNTEERSGKKNKQKGDNSPI